MLVQMINENNEKRNENLFESFVFIKCILISRFGFLCLIQSTIFPRIAIFLCTTGATLHLFFLLLSLTKNVMALLFVIRSVLNFGFMYMYNVGISIDWHQKNSNHFLTKKSQNFPNFSKNFKIVQISQCFYVLIQIDCKTKSNNLIKLSGFERPVVHIFDSGTIEFSFFHMIETTFAHTTEIHDDFNNNRKIPNSIHTDWSQ